MTQGWLVFIVKKKGGITLYKSSGQTPDKAKDRAIEKFKIESMDAEIREVKLYSIQQIFAEDITPVNLGVYPGLYLAEKDNKKLKDDLKYAYIHLLEAADSLEAEGFVETRDKFYSHVPRNTIGNEAFLLHTGIERSSQTI